MKLSELQELLKRVQELHPDQDPEVVIPTRNPSVGPSSVSSVYAGFDWNKGRLFLRPEKDLCYVAKVTNDQIRARGDEYATYTHEKLNFKYPHSRRDSWLEGWFEGAKWGTTKLLEENAVEHE